MGKKNKNGRGGKTGKKPQSPLSLRERTIIEFRYREGKTLTAIAKEVGRDKGTISREIGGKPRVGRGAYNADRAHAAALERIKKRGNTSLLSRHEKLREYVVKKLKLGWSPEQISLRLPIEFPDDETMRICHEAVYQYVYAQVHRGGNGTLKKGCEDLRSLLRRRRKRRMKKGSRKAQKVERESALPSIETRPEIVGERSRVGDWEDDTMVSRASKPRVKSINERKSGLFFFGKTVDGTASSCDDVVQKRLGEIPKQYRITLTRDRGSENRGHESLAQSLKLDIFFAHPYCSHERGSNENGNGLFRWYFPKKTNFDTISDKDIAHVEFLINSRPRKRFGGYTPYEVFYQLTGVALIP